MTFPVTATSHTLADYRARGGYATLAKVLESMAPQDVTKEVTASGILGHGGAAFSAGRKWGVIKLDDGQPHYLCANADEGEPGTFKDRWILEHAPHLLIESMLIAVVRAAGAQRVRLHPRRVRPAVPPPRRRGRGGLRGRLARRADPRHRFLLRPRRLPRRRILRLRRGLRAALVARGQARLSAQPPAAADREGPLPAAHGGQQRRDARQRHGDHRAWAPRRSRRWARRRARARSSSRSPATSRARASTRSSTATR